VLDGLKTCYRFARGATGPLWDLAAAVRFDPRHPQPLTKALHLKAIARRSGARTLVEVGTLYGDTARRCAHTFARLYTIELDDELAERAAERLRGHANITVLRGEGTPWLRKLGADGALRDALVYLDGHYSGFGTARAAVDEPAVEELLALLPHAAELAAIVVDDFRLFGTPGTPSKGELFAAIEAFRPHGFDAIVHLDQVVLTREKNCSR
jgi:predicted O-methyltransferase YrrM